MAPWPILRKVALSTVILMRTAALPAKISWYLMKNAVGLSSSVWGCFTMACIRSSSWTALVLLASKPSPYRCNRHPVNLFLEEMKGEPGLLCSGEVGFGGLPKGCHCLTRQSILENWHGTSDDLSAGALHYEGHMMGRDALGSQIIDGDRVVVGGRRCRDSFN
ncbi:hypothetical protein B0H67DRAFT_567497 [Lasiosphaeris hirsuta]|uniref:Uncharacterized protein n=1 Tax=Lasiosphaeris hirsuta TaxID=260670 RepID=A0AA40E6G7_9PEZI|nr:hypothetical protein B0H67DRAFT_567497 [Lasiosphaeris hirsuta]